ncbi:unnamed protein product [Dibothriocephalus latus]|uniref:Uncharacterized protein n=1 Tax=Dibothriocephalus latus TaxID=60516 RepID=A0A3P6U3R0_DIBLA|nr:unnamed protein product [Dibothriocephalus latus]
MTSLSLLLMFAVAQVLVCQASPNYQNLEVEDEKDVKRGDLKLTAKNKEEEEMKSFNDVEVDRSQEHRLVDEVNDFGLSIMPKCDTMKLTCFGCMPLAN